MLDNVYCYRQGSKKKQEERNRKLNTSLAIKDVPKIIYNVLDSR
jgi:hypothetical protein